MKIKQKIKNIIFHFLSIFSARWIASSSFLETLQTFRPTVFSNLNLNIAKRKLSKEATIAIIIQYLNHFMQNSSAKDNLEILFELDHWMYQQEGKNSVKYNHGLHTKHRHINYYRFFTDHIEDGQTVLDLGCGNGALTYHIAQKTTAAVLGIDFSERNIEYAKNNYSTNHITYQLGNIYTDLPNQHFDVVTMSNVLEHLEDRVKILQTIKHTISPDRLILRVPLFERDWRVPLKQELGLDYRLDPTHFIEYTQETFVDEITQAGFKITYQETRWGEIWAVLKISKS